MCNILWRKMPYWQCWQYKKIIAQNSWHILLNIVNNIGTICFADAAALITHRLVTTNLSCDLPGPARRLPGPPGHGPLRPGTGFGLQWHRDWQAQRRLGGHVHASQARAGGPVCHSPSGPVRVGGRCGNSRSSSSDLAECHGSHESLRPCRGGNQRFPGRQWTYVAGV